MDAVVKPWPKAAPSDASLSEHVRLAPQPPGPRQISDAERKLLFGQDRSVVK